MEKEWEMGDNSLFSLSELANSLFIFFYFSPQAIAPHDQPTMPKNDLDVPKDQQPKTAKAEKQGMTNPGTTMNKKPPKGSARWRIEQAMKARKARSKL